MIKHRICRICGNPVILRPSASERASRYGYSAKHYLDLFPDHSECIIAKRESETRRLIESKKESSNVE